MSAQLEELHDQADADRALKLPLALILKHSTRCSVSNRALAIVQQFAEENPSIPVYVVPVIECRPVSNYLAERTDVRHQSPQALLLRFGRPVWHGSHFDISMKTLSEAVLGAGKDR
ncbi:MAG: bacillithiol system redox-active protein YtxJ [Acidobacteriota bacterium]